MKVAKKIYFAKSTLKYDPKSFNKHKKLSLSLAKIKRKVEPIENDFYLPEITNNKIWEEELEIDELAARTHRRRDRPSLKEIMGHTRSHDRDGTTSSHNNSERSPIRWSTPAQ